MPSRPRALRMGAGVGVCVCVSVSVCLRCPLRARGEWACRDVMPLSIRTAAQVCTRFSRGAACHPPRGLSKPLELRGTGATHCGRRRSCMGPFWCRWGGFAFRLNYHLEIAILHVRWCGAATAAPHHGAEPALMPSGRHMCSADTCWHEERRAGDRFRFLAPVSLQPLYNFLFSPICRSDQSLS